MATPVGRLTLSGLLYEGIYHEWSERLTANVDERNLTFDITTGRQQIKLGSNIFREQSGSHPYVRWRSSTPTKGRSLSALTAFITKRVSQALMARVPDECHRMPSKMLQHLKVLAQPFRLASGTPPAYL
jgi:hypothetical protein